MSDDMPVKVKKIKAITNFLKEYEIWFKTILSFCLTLTAIMVSIASYTVARYQASMTAQSIRTADSEKQPFFSIENIFIDENKEYAYIVRNTGGEARYFDATITPYLCVKQYNDIGQRKNCAFIEMPGFFDNYSITSDGDIIFSFRDKKINNKLADDYFSSFTCSDNQEGLDISMNSSIVYEVTISYYDYKNEEKGQSFLLSRMSDIKQLSNGNSILYLDNFLHDLLIDAVKNKEVYSVDSLNLDNDQIVTECSGIITKLRAEFGQTQLAHEYMDSHH